MKSSSVINLVRGHGDDLELFWSKRRHELAFLGGFWAFAGGSVEADDETVPLAGDIPQGFPARVYFGCAARETFEELGLLVTTTGVRHVSEDAELRRRRDELHGTHDFAGWLRARGEQIDADRFTPTGKWETPDWFDIAFDSEFFALCLTPTENAQFGAAISDHLLRAELIDGEWTTPAAALAVWRAAERYITLPIRRHIEALERATTAREVDIHSIDVPLHYAEFVAVPGIYMVPLRSATIPPATHTNCLLVGEERFVIIDPGSPYERNRDHLATLVSQMVDDGRELVAAVLTHHHPDHVAGVADLVARFSCDVWAHANTAQHVDFDVQRHIEDGEVIELDNDSLRAVFTPGHASGHLCFHHERTNAMIGGDLIASAGTILVNPPDGHMGDYLASLARVRDLEPAALYPAHGWIVTNPVDRLQFYIDHRRAREEKVFDALTRFSAAATAADLVPDAYDDAPQTVWPIAARSAEAHLIHLVELGRAERVGARYRVATHT